MSVLSLPVATLGVPRIGPRRELKSALERYWSGKIDATALQEAATGLRAASWACQAARGVSVIPSNDFSLYDHVLDTAVMVGAVPAIYGWSGGAVPLDSYFAMARGSQGAETSCSCGHDASGVPALEMTKWFDTNYHYMVPEFQPGQSFSLASTKPIDEYREAAALGFATRPVLLGPVSFLKLGKSHDASFDRLTLLAGLMPTYIEVLRRLAANGAEWVQLDEPCLVLDLSDAERRALREAYGMIAYALPKLKIMLTSYFGGLGGNLETALALPVAGLHLDLVRAPEQLGDVLAKAPRGLVLSLGVIDGRNIWRADLDAILTRLEPVVGRRGADHLELAPSCSLLHVPVDLELETDIDPDLKRWLAFALQKMGELSVLGKALAQGRGAVRGELDDAAAAIASRRSSTKVHDAAVAARTAAVEPWMSWRANPYPERQTVQREALKLPQFPTTTIGSFPQTAEVRKARAAFAKGELGEDDYNAFLRRETEAAVKWQEDIGIDVLVHGEFERNDMVQYFGEQLAGYAFTKHGWVQSYGSRYVRPPIIFGDVSRPAPMTVAWSSFAQSLTSRPMKGMLTGPVTMLQWSFVRDDLPRAEVCRQIALALRDEVTDLEAAGLKVIQIDEPALREGLPLRRAEWRAYLDWAVDCFRLAAAGVRDGTQIHTHMCYAEFNDIIDSIGALDADVISIETSRSKMELLEAFALYHYPNEIGPGVYDIHSPRVPTTAEMIELLTKAARRLSPDQIWVNPDCGLKTRRWEEVRPALVNMMEAARQMRANRAEAAE
ncbi:5-methyltetrahydropteroyltriglutamate--homocysteine S-methyltransferase [Blastochloris viridis]|uniref:5-methyltetrahydropteroyltriglutamate--homocysteine methyltransferase n=1 Tax=Blastochloris viridis TaxID=1079 RepID=A0A0H5BQ17_BLAVI|nr:5-methyltetrahydropteroyltriglutamate--homocysteine S-methyltransferase [Blastochloris viridis]ALK09881.1 5-methyltetrahydropteroyltriglutamate--homocysteine methyltransferase [Blastochloris viridis]BAS00214.1 5-methyltetrahydropteroyltriglutamate--homocysteine methyltransferase [Blastochloris viridis]CUU42544.1 5-methyltetrahydropteroyltriglutamate--homocysteine methyltransferase [Blastochloris viridis]